MQSLQFRSKGCKITNIYMINERICINWKKYLKNHLVCSYAFWYTDNINNQN